MSRREGMITRALSLCHARCCGQCRWVSFWNRVSNISSKFDQGRTRPEISLSLLWSLTQNHSSPSPLCVHWLHGGLITCAIKTSVVSFIPLIISLISVILQDFFCVHWCQVRIAARELPTTPPPLPSPPLLALTRTKSHPMWTARVWSWMSPTASRLMSTK